MQYRVLGRSGLVVSVLGFGSLTIGGSAHLWGTEVGLGRTDDSESLRAIAQAIHAGINLFDTAPSYGNTHAEELLGRGLQGHRSDIIICTKVGMLPRAEPPVVWNFSSASLRAQVEGSLRRLRTDYIDVLLLHCPDKSMLNEQLWETCADLQVTGKIRVLGLSTNDLQQATTFVIDRRIEVLQLRYNLLDQQAATIFPLIQEHDAGLMVHTPLALGLLTGRFGSDHQFAADDYRSTKFSNTLSTMLRQVAQLHALAGREHPLATLAIQFILSQSEISSCLVGIRNAAQVVRNAEAVSQPSLPPTLLRHLRQLWEQWQKEHEDSPTPSMNTGATTP